MDNTLPKLTFKFKAKYAETQGDNLEYDDEDRVGLATERQGKEYDQVLSPFKIIATAITQKQQEMDFA